VTLSCRVVLFREVRFREMDIQKLAHAGVTAWVPTVIDLLEKPFPFGIVSRG